MRYLSNCLVIFLYVSFSCFHNALSLDLDHEITELLKAKTNQNNLDFEIRYDSIYKAQQIKLSNSNNFSINLVKFNPKTQIFTAEISLLDKNNKILIAGRYSPYMHIPIAKKVIAAGNKISEEDVIYLKTKVTNLSKNIIVSADELIGMQSKNTISIGKTFNKDDIHKPWLIFKDQSVDLTYSSANLTIKTIGIALESGSVGDFIKIKNEKSSNIVIAKIINEKTVMVEE